MPCPGRSSPVACNWFPVQCWDWTQSPAKLLGRLWWVCEEVWQPWHTEPCCPLQTGCPSTILLSPQEALDGRAPQVWGWCLLGLWEGGWEMLCLHPPGSGVGCCNITCSFGPKQGTELTTNNVQLLNVFCQKERKIKPCCKEPLQTWSHWHPPMLVGPWGLWA